MAFSRDERTSGDELEVQLAHVMRQLRPGELGLIEILEARVANRVRAFDARMTLKLRWHDDVLGFRFHRRILPMLREKSFRTEAQSLREDAC